MRKGYWNPSKKSCEKMKKENDDWDKKYMVKKVMM